MYRPATTPRARRDDGAALIEFALVLLPLIGVLMGIITGGIAYFTGIQLSTAAQEGARVMYVGGTVDEARQAVVNAGQVNPAITAGEVIINGSCTPATVPPATVTVTVERNADVRWFFGSNTVTLTGRGVVRCQ
jgi:Flp pilus assembly protein TadG